MSLLVVLLFMPAFSALFWLILNPILARRTGTFLIMQALSLGLLLYFISDGFYATPGIPPELLLYARLLMDGAAPCLIPVIWLYMHRLIHRKRFYPSQFIWILAPVSLLIAGIVFTEISEKPVIADFLLRLYREGTSIAQEYKGTPLWHYYFWTSLLFRYVIGIELAAAAAYLIRYVIKQKFNIVNLWNFFFRGGAIRITELQIVNLILPGIFISLKLVFLKSYLDTHIWMSIFLGTVVTLGYFFLMICSLFGEKDEITLVQARHVMFFNYNHRIKGPIVEIMMEELLDEASQDSLVRFQEKLAVRISSDNVAPKTLSEVKEQLLARSAVGTWDDSLLTKFKALMLNEQLFLKPSLTLTEVAIRLRTNKTYVSKLVNNTYNLGFPELLNTLRVDYSQQYLLEHPDAKQEEVASASGFLSASSFNSIFKKITGMTPKVWLVSLGPRK